MNDHPHGHLWRKWLAPFVNQPERGLELGTFKGESAEWFLNNILTHPLSSLICVDTFLGGADHHAHGVDCTGLREAAETRLALHAGRVALLERTTERFFRTCAWENFAFCYVDASHAARDVLSDAVHAWPLLQPGGVLIFDDYRWKEMPDPLDRPKIAIDAFASCYAREMEVLEPVGWQIAFRKLT